MNPFDPSAYGPAFGALLRDAPLSALGPGKPDPARRPLLEALAGDDAFRPRRVADRRMADACRAGMWLLYDFLDESHAISQEISTPEGSYWHALLHRREPDFSNSAYWFRRVGPHPVFEPLREEAARLAVGGPADTAFLVRQANWDPFGFGDLCEASLSGAAPCERSVGPFRSANGAYSSITVSGGPRREACPIGPSHARPKPAQASSAARRPWNARDGRINPAASRCTRSPARNTRM